MSGSIGSHIQEELGARGWTPADLLRRAGVNDDENSQEWIVKLLRLDVLFTNKEVRLLSSEAELYARGFDVSPDFLLNLDSIYHGEPVSIFERLRERYTAEEARRWWRTPQPQLDGQIPAVVFKDGRIAEIVAILDRLESGAYL